MGKSIFLSKTFWLNLIALVGIVINHYYPFVSLTPELQGIILIGINMLLRIFTNKPIEW